MSMKLQVALDDISIDKAISLVEDLHDLIDIVEIGTPFIVNDGLEPVRQMKKRFPNLTILADIKIMDGAKIEAKAAFDAGTDIVTVLALAEEQTILDTVNVAKAYNKEVLADMIAVRDIPAKTELLEPMGVDYLCVHNAFDLREMNINPLKELVILKQYVKSCKTAVAGGVTLSTLPSIVGAAPDIVIIGQGITGEKNPRATVRKMKKDMESHGHGN